MILWGTRKFSTEIDKAYGQELDCNTLFFFSINNLLHGAHRQAIADTVYLLIIPGLLNTRNYNKKKS